MYIMCNNKKQNKRHKNNRKQLLPNKPQTLWDLVRVKMVLFKIGGRGNGCKWGKSIHVDTVKK